MKYNPMKHNRRSIRMKGYDYSKAGLYFITFRVQNGEMLFGAIENGQMILNNAGKMILAEWGKLPQRFNNIELHEFVVMPNHFHGIVEIITPVGAPLVGAQISGVHDDGNNDTARAGDGATANVRAPLVGAQISGAHDDGNNDTARVGDGTTANVGAPLVGAQISGAHDDGNNDTARAGDGATANVRAPLVGAQISGAHDDGNNDTARVGDGAAANVGAPLVGAQISGAHDDGNNDTAHAGDGTTANERASTRGAPTEGPMRVTVGEMMGAFKSITTLEYINGANNLGWEPFAGKLWQRNFYEHIIRNEISYYKISDYIVNNPARWKDDKFYLK
jgi:putative transposase